MSNDMPSYWFFCVRGKHASPIDLSHNLISDYDCNSEFICQTLELPQELSQTHLSCRKLTSA